MNMKEAIESVQQSIDQMISTSRALSDDMLTWKPADNVWSVKEILCHVDEAIPYWLDEINRLVEHPGVEWGRGLQDEKRLAALAQADSRSVDEVLASIAKTKEQVQFVLDPLTEDELIKESPSRNPRFGTKPLSFIIHHLLVDHASGHVKQINRNIEQYHAAK